MASTAYEAEPTAGTPDDLDVFVVRRGFGDTQTSGASDGLDVFVVRRGFGDTQTSGASDGLDVFVVRRGFGDTFAPAVERAADGLAPRTAAFTAVIGDAAGDERGEPVLTPHG